MYNKLFTKILDSTIWLEPTPTRVVWITLLASMDEDGFAQYASIENLARRAIVPISECTAAVDALERPDTHNTEQEHEGKRIERVPGGWLVLNAPKYRAIVKREISLEQNRRNVAAWRERQRAKHGVAKSNESVSPQVLPTAKCKGGVRQSEALADQSPSAASLPARMTEFRAAYPKRAGGNPWTRAERAIQARIKEGATWDAMIDGARRYAEFVRATGKEGTEFVMQAATFCGPDRLFLDDWSIPKDARQPQPSGLGPSLPT